MKGLVYEHFDESVMGKVRDFEGKQPVSLICGLDPASKEIRLHL